MKNLILVCCLSLVVGVLQAQENTPVSKDGKCHAKCLISDKYEEMTENYPIYTGKNPEKIDTKTIHERSGNQLFVIEYMTDTSQSDEYYIETGIRKRFLKPGGYTEWREIICEDKITPTITRNLIVAVRNAGYDIPNTITALSETRFKAALTKYQKDNGLPVGQLDLETLDALGIEY